ncbi:MAG TPA: alpha/beta hydrolase, partial [Candidatus Deferrimicrobium sp.]|nr:alpha/beta hydrolase [Candidatus Deferrimicrobium sp.]
MPRARVGDLELEYETFGDPSGTPLLLVMGLAYQMIEWDERVCRALAERGFWVIRFDNRDVGLSTKMDELGNADLTTALAGRPALQYTLDDMAGDAAGLLDVLGVRAAHVVGASMGGMIAQLLAINHPDRVLSLTSIMSTVGGPEVVQADDAVLRELLAPPGQTREERIEHSVAVRRLINGRGLPFDEDDARRRAARAVDRNHCPDGALRQLMAIVTAPDRAPALRRLGIPTLVIHGENDPLVPVENGRQTAAALPGARVMILPAMGHHLPERVWAEVLDALVEVTSKSTL